MARFRIDSSIFKLIVLCVFLTGPKHVYGQAGMRGTQSGATAGKGNCAQNGVCAPEQLSPDEIEAAVCQKKLGSTVCQDEFCKNNPVLKCATINNPTPNLKPTIPNPGPGPKPDPGPDPSPSPDPAAKSDPSGGGRFKSSVVGSVPASCTAGCFRLQ